MAIIARLMFGLPLSREAIIPQVKPNPISGFKDQCLAPLISVLDILAYLPFNLKLDVMVQVFNKGSFFKTNIAQHLIKYGNRKEVKGCEGIEPIHNLKRGVGSSRINYLIIGKLNMRYQVFPHPWVPKNKAPQHLTQSPINHLCLTISLGMPSSRKQESSKSDLRT